MTEEMTPEELKQFQEMQVADSEEPEPTPEPEPEPAPEPEPTPEPERKPEIDERKVPIKALHEERNRRKEMQRELQELKEKFARADERIRILAENKDQDFDDPDVLAAREKEELKRKIYEQEQALTKTKEDIEHRVNEMQFRTTIQNMERSFEQSTPDYKKALSYAIDVRKAALEEAGYEDEEVEGFIDREFSDVVRTAMAKGRNPAEAVYKMAQKMGYKNEKPQPKIEALQKGSAASKSLSQGGGKPDSELTAEALAEMSDEEFAKLSDSDFRKVFGG